MAIYFPTSAFFLAFGVVGFIRAHQVWILVFMSAIAVLCLHAIAYSRRVLILGINEFSIAEFRTHLYSVSDFKGFRMQTTQGRYGYLRDYRLEGYPGHRSVSLVKQGLLYEYDQADIRVLRDWLKSKLPDLDVLDRQAEAAERRQVALSGGHRLPSRSRSRSIAKALNWLVVVYSIAVFLAASRGLIAGPAVRAAAVLGLLALPATIAVKSWSPSSFQFGSLVGGGAPPSIDIALLFGALFPVAVTWRFCQPLRWSQVWVPAALVSGLLIALTVKLAIGRRDHAAATMSFVSIMLMLYGAGVVTTANAALDFASPSRQMAGIVHREIRARECYWTLQFENRRGLVRRVSVSRDLYDAYNVTAHAPVPVMVTVGHGAFGIEWIVDVGR